MSEAEKLKFVTIELSRKQVDMNHPIHNNRMQKDYLRIYAPGGGVIFYPADSIKVKKEDPERVYFSRPEGTLINVSYSKLKEGVSADSNLPKEKKYENHTKPVKIEDLKEMFEEAKKAYQQKHDNEKLFYNVEISKKLIRNFTANGKELVSVSVPVFEKPTDEKPVFYEIVLQANWVKEAERAGMAVVSMFQNGVDGNAYNFTAKRSVLKSGSATDYETVTRIMTSAEVMKHFEFSAEKFKKNNQNDNASSSLADELNRTHQGAEEQGESVSHIKRHRR